MDYAARQFAKALADFQRHKEAPPSFGEEIDQLVGRTVLTQTRAPTSELTRARGHTVSAFLAAVSTTMLDPAHEVAKPRGQEWGAERTRSRRTKAPATLNSTSAVRPTDGRRSCDGADSIHHRTVASSSRPEFERISTTLTLRRKEAVIGVPITIQL
ncbi:hypothetical protein LshimejAT787_0904840 [Lyophyllum shimeji]|uniref:Uncharacterized protein n=1 Tax=Lyophyllum shimeji TaxID=47721 RepID=A0A9P3PTH2_LYOSH|nr:hypothetical protein LshimejAT787_0904840 [Lyophyllum shimeji]